MCPLVTLRDREERSSSLLWPTRIVVDVSGKSSRRIRESSTRGGFEGSPDRAEGPAFMSYSGHRSCPDLPRRPDPPRKSSGPAQVARATGKSPGPNRSPGLSDQGVSWGPVCTPRSCRPYLAPEARQWRRPASFVKLGLRPVDNTVSYPQAARSRLAGSRAAPHAGGMRQTLAAGDDTPRTPQIPQAPPDPQDAHDLHSPRDSQGRDDRQPDLVVRAGSPAALLTLVPHLLGFVPEATWS